MKKYLFLLSLTFFLLASISCSSPKDTHLIQNTEENTVKTSDSIPSEAPEEESEDTEITMWTFPIGDFGDEDVVNSFVSSFNKLHPDISISVEILDYATGDEQIEEAIRERKTPDIIMEGPERLVANWGARGLMIDLKDMLDANTLSDINAVSQEVVLACQAPDGAFYQYPLVMTTHVMAINYELFEQADALQYLDENTRTWTTEGFISAMEAIRDSGLVSTPGVIYCGGQGGDQGTRSLVTNLYNAPFTNTDHNAYLLNEELGVQGLTLLLEMTNNNSLSFDTELVASDELQMFSNQETAVTFAWNSSNESIYATEADFTPFAMNFPSSDGIAELQGGIWGFGIFNNGSESKVQAAKKFIDFLANDPNQRELSVKSTNFFSVKQSVGNVYLGTEDEDRMAIYSSFLPNLGDYYQVTLAWTDQRTAWYQMLQQVFLTGEVQAAANTYVETLNPLISP